MTRAVATALRAGSRTPSRMLNEFLKQPVEYIVTQSFFFSDRITAEQMEQFIATGLACDREGSLGRESGVMALDEAISPPTSPLAGSLGDRPPFGRSPAAAGPVPNQIKGDLR